MKDLIVDVLARVGIAFAFGLMVITVFALIPSVILIFSAGWPGVYATLGLLAFGAVMWAVFDTMMERMY